MTTTPYESQADWMSRVSDSVLLSELTLPGTHDTMAWQYSSWGDVSICHDKGLIAQLQCGVRFLDLRLCYVKNGKLAANFALHHAGDYQNAYFDFLTDHSKNPECTSFVLDTCSEFLQFNPTECIVMTLSQENSSETPANVGAVLNAIFKLHGAERTFELQRSKAYLAETQRLSHTGSFGWDVSSGEIYWSDETFRIFELDPKTEITTELTVQRTHPDDRQAVQQVIERASSERTEFALEHRLLMPDGSIKYVHVVGHLELTYGWSRPPIVI